MAIDHASYMKLALNLACKGGRQVRPNPLVGCLVVKGKRVVGSGYHKRFGGPHAEPQALKMAGAQARGARLYVTLEPCCSWGKTGPCVPEILRAGIKEVFIGVKDPNPYVNGKGIDQLRKAGIKVVVGLNELEATYLNASFRTWIRNNRAHVVLKMAQSWDGKIATTTSQSRWISGPSARDWVHSLRAASDAIVVGASTAILDNPRLTSHGVGANPARVIIDPRLRCSPTLNVFNSPGQRFVITNYSPENLKAKPFIRRGVEVIQGKISSGSIDLKSMLEQFYLRGIYRVLVEGGGTTAWEFVRQKVVDEVYFVVAPLLIGGKRAPSSIDGLGFSSLDQAVSMTAISYAPLGEDLLLHGLVK